jgi:hypothetical protein
MQDLLPQRAGTNSGRMMVTMRSDRLFESAPRATERGRKALRSVQRFTQRTEGNCGLSRLYLIRLRYKSLSVIREAQLLCDLSALLRVPA